MRIAYSCIKQALGGNVPEPAELRRLLTMRSFEIESLEEVDGDWYFEADILPNRQHDCLCERYFIKEVAAITGVTFAALEATLPEGAAPSVSVSIEDARCRRFVAVEASNLKVQPSPDWLVKKNAAVGQRAINSAVDASNFVLYVENQPTHAFDLDRVKGAITIRASRAGESLEILGGKTIALDEGTLVIADEEGPLDIAGVKGGARSGVTEATTRVLLTAANIDGSAVRKAAQRYDLRTDASKRFEAQIAPELAERGMARFVETLKNLSLEATFSGALDIWPRRAHAYRTGVSASEASALLGRPVTLGEAARALEAVGCEVSEIASPAARLAEVAREAEGKPYKYGASVLYDAPNAFDCSSLVAYAAAEAGLSAPRMSVDQYAWGRDVAEAELQPGDLVFSCIDGVGPSVHREPQKRTMEYAKGTPVPEPGIDHCGIYAGNGEVIHATERGGGLVKREPLAASEQFKTIVGYRRPVPAGEPRLVVTPPAERLDLRAPEDLIEEIGRLGDLEQLPATPLPEMPAAVAAGEFALARAIRAELTSIGFYEIMTSSFSAEGDIEVLKPANAEKPKLRTSVLASFQKALRDGFLTRHLLGKNEVKLFEIGKAFRQIDGQSKETLQIVVGAAAEKVPFTSAMVDVPCSVLSDRGVLRESVEDPAENFSANYEMAGYGKGVGVAKVFTLNPQASFVAESRIVPLPSEHRYKAFSPYPYSARDVAVWVPGEGGEEAKVAGVIRAAAGPLLVKLYKFDEFTKRKEGEPVRTSYAFRLILQAADRTLSDSEIAAATDAAYAALRAEGWEIR